MFSFSSLQAVLFDMDGVLIDARDWHYQALNQALEVFGYSITEYDHKTTFDGLPTLVKLEMLSQTEGLPPYLHELISALKQKNTLRLAARHTLPTFAHEHLLSTLSSSGIKLACCSNSIKTTIVDMLTRANIFHYFDVIISNQDVDLPKPSPLMYLKAMNTLEVDPDKVVILEDNPHGLEAARASKAHVLQVADPSDVSISRLLEFISIHSI